MLVKALHFGLTALTVFGIYGFCRREADRTTGLFAGLFYYSAHYIAINSWSCGNDAANSFLAFLAMAAMVRWCVKKQSSWWIASALFAGLSLSAKYTSLYGVAAVGLVWGFVQVREWWASRSSGSAAEGSSVPPTPLIPALGRMAVWCAIVFALFSPWLVKNAVWVGNPVHPFFYRQFGDQNINRSRTLTEKAVIPGTVLNFQQWSLERLFTAPWWLTMTGNDSVRGIGPVFLLFLPLLIFLKGMPRGLRLSLALKMYMGAFLCLVLPARERGILSNRTFIALENPNVSLGSNTVSRAGSPGVG
jgi:4-amino-4-deoxy-L-arabinose transferase-like glycosyltransferase